MHIDQFDYDLPDPLIAQFQAEPRSASRLMLLNRQTGQLSHHIFSDLVDLLDDSYVLVLNDTQVFPARLFGKKDTGGKAEVLLLKQIETNAFQAIGRGALKPGTTIIFSPDLKAAIVTKNEAGELVLKFDRAGSSLLKKIDELGNTPLPPYIRSRDSELDLRDKYQTVYASARGSAAAPTAGLHFTADLLNKLAQKGIQIEKITLHVGLGTFKPVLDEQVVSKKLHTESFVVNPETANRLNQAKKFGKKIIAVGTTSCRVLETISNRRGVLQSGEGETDIFIQPGYRFKFVDGLITNFHLPKTSLLMLVSALTCSPNSPTPFQNFSSSPIGQAYKEAIKKKYRFFSFGDAMYITS